MGCPIFSQKFWDKGWGHIYISDRLFWAFETEGISGTLHPIHFKHGKIYDPVNSQAGHCCIGAVDDMLKPGKCRFFFGQWEYPDTRPGCRQSAGYGGGDLHHVHIHAGLAML